MPCRSIATYLQEEGSEYTWNVEFLKKITAVLDADARRILAVHLLFYDLERGKQFTYHRLAQQISLYKPDHIVLINGTEPHWMLDYDLIFKDIVKDTPYTLLGSFTSPNSIYLDATGECMYDKVPAYTEEELRPIESDKFYLSHNRVAYPMRTRLYELLLKNNLLDYGFVSYTSRNDLPSSSIPEQLTEQQRHTNSKQPFANATPLDGWTLGDITVWQQQIMIVASDHTWTDKPSVLGNLHLSEKHYKPIVGLRPFLSYTNPDNVRKLRDIGFDTFEDAFDLDSDVFLISEEHSRQAIVKTLLRFSQLNTQQRLEWYNSLLPRLRKNRELFFEHIQAQKAMIEGFKIAS